MKRFIAEWEPQSLIQLTWPRENSDWAQNYPQAFKCFVDIAKNIIRFQRLLIVCTNHKLLINHFNSDEIAQITFFETDYNDSWARDHGGISVETNGKITIIDFKFTGWGGKFEWEKDNALTKKLFNEGIFNCLYQNELDFVLEGGALETDGKGTLLSTKACLLNPNRNPNYSLKAMEEKLTQTLGIKRFLWLNEGGLLGDDTDAHIDTLVRFANPNTIVYVQCANPKDAHYTALSAMEKELKQFTTEQGTPYNLIPLPLPTPQYAKVGNYRIPATYANYLILNGVILLPIYNCIEDHLAIQRIQIAFPKHQIIPIDCSALIQQHGSLHCITMQYYH